MVAGKNVVVTGKIAGESRLTAERKLRELGASTQSSVTATTDLLITGEAVGESKRTKAEKLGVRIVAWEDAIRGPDREPAVRTASVARLGDRVQVAPQLAQQAEVPPKGPEWQHEIKWDGVRCIATVVAGAVSMQSRSDLTDYTGLYPEVAAAIAKLPDGVYDGEIVTTVEGGGNFQQLRNGGGVPVFMAFDLVECMGANLRSKPLSERRALLDQATLGHRGPRKRIALSATFFDADGQGGAELLAFVADKGMEGIVSKRLSSRYQEGARNGDWLKIKVRLGQEFVVVGWKEGEGSRAGRIGSILLGAHVDGVLTFVGRCGTGTTIEGWDALRRKLGKSRGLGGATHIDLTRAKKPELRDVEWVEPRVVVQVEFQRWTEDGRLWHPSYKGIRDDKLAADVVVEG